MFKMSKRVNVLFFANLREKAGVRDTIIELIDEAIITDLRVAVARAYPDLNDLIFSALVAVNREYAGENDVVPDGAEIAFFPRVSGGRSANQQTICKVQTESIVIQDFLSELIQPTTGALCTFIGVVREVTGREFQYRTEYLEYDAYHVMAESKMLQIAREIRERWPDIEGIVFVQRIGKVDSGVLSVLIACSAAHRDGGVFDAVHYGIDRLKEIVPVWKKEIGLDGEEWIEGDYQPAPGE
jgi:molybdopterin synthase catalytic subunit